MSHHLTLLCQKELEENYGLIHEEWFQRIVNWNLTTYNSKYSNNFFYEKKTKMFLDRRIWMNTYISQKDKWILVELRDRSDYLKVRVFQVRFILVTNFLIAEKQMDGVTLEGHISLSEK